MENGIWLCSNCSIAIDRDVKRYPVDLLKQWKSVAEQLAKEELGKKLPSKHDAIDTLTTAFTGQPKGFISHAISNVHKASASALEALDPRFAVKTTFADGVTQIGVFPKQDVSLLMNVKKEYAKEISSKYRQLVDHGIELVMKGDAITIEGSRLLTELASHSPVSTIKLSPTKFRATQKIWLLNKSTSLVETFDDINGGISAGRQSFSFEGAACDSIFVFSYQKSLEPIDGSATVSIGINFEKWSRIDVRALPYFNKIYSFFEKIHDGWALFTSLEINGIEVLRSKEVALGAPNFATEILRSLDVINMAKSVAEALNTAILFNPTYTFTAEEFSGFCNAVSIARGLSVFRKDELKENIKSELVVDRNADNVSQLLQLHDPIDFQLRQASESELRLFGQLIKLPNTVVNIRSAIPRLISTTSINELRDGDKVSIEWIPSDNFECRIAFAERTDESGES